MNMRCRFLACLAFLAGCTSHTDIPLEVQVGSEPESLVSPSGFELTFFPAGSPYTATLEPVSEEDAALFISPVSGRCGGVWQYSGSDEEAAQTPRLSRGSEKACPHSVLAWTRSPNSTWAALGDSTQTLRSNRGLLAWIDIDIFPRSLDRVYAGTFLQFFPVDENDLRPGNLSIQTRSLSPGFVSSSTEYLGSWLVANEPTSVASVLVRIPGANLERTYTFEIAPNPARALNAISGPQDLSGPRVGPFEAEVRAGNGVLLEGIQVALFHDGRVRAHALTDARGRVSLGFNTSGPISGPVSLVVPGTDLRVRFHDSTHTGR